MSNSFWTHSREPLLFSEMLSAERLNFWFFSLNYSPYGECIQSACTCKLIFLYMYMTCSRVSLAQIWNMRRKVNTMKIWVLGSMSQCRTMPDLTRRMTIITAKKHISNSRRLTKIMAKKSRMSPCQRTSNNPKVTNSTATAGYRSNRLRIGLTAT